MAPITTFLVASLSMFPLVSWFNRRKQLDHPSERSLHSLPTARGAGIAVALGLLSGFAILGSVPWPFWLAVIGFTIIGAWDDRYSTTVAPKLAGQIVIAAAVAFGIVDALTLSSALIITTLSLLLTVNAVNFMDGVNGITALHAILWGFTYAALFWIVGLPSVVPLALCLAASAIAFLPWNFPRARVFLGDSGSYLIGALVGVFAVIGVATHEPVAFLAPLTIYGLDTATTLFRRLATRKDILQPHRDHIFQKIAAAGPSHVRSAFVVVGFSSVATAFGMASLLLPDWGYAIAGAGLGAVILSYLALPSLFLRGRTNHIGK